MQISYTYMIINLNKVGSYNTIKSKGKESISNYEK